MRKLKQTEQGNTNPVVAVEAWTGPEWLRRLVQEPGRFPELVDGAEYHFTTSFNSNTLVMTIEAREAQR